MRINKYISEFMTAFFVCTTCITILEGILGMIFFPEERLPYEAFFSPPLFVRASWGVTKSKKELSVRQILFRRAIHLLLIEGMVFGLNYLSDHTFEPVVTWTLAISIAFIFVAVYVIMWLNDQRSATLFNEKLKLYQNREA